MIDDFVCALTNIRPEPAELGIPSPVDGLGRLPVGWLAVTVQRRYYNPEWIEIQQTKEVMFQQAISTVPPEHHEAAARVIRIQIAAQFASLENDIDRYVTVEETVFISDPDKNSTVRGEVANLRGLLGLPALSNPE